MHTYNTYVIHRCVLSLLANCLCYGEQFFSKRTCAPKVRAIRHLRVRASLLPCRRLLPCALPQGPLLRQCLLKLLKLGHPFWRSLPRKSHRRQHCSSSRHHHRHTKLLLKLLKLGHPFWRSLPRKSHRRQHCSSYRHHHLWGPLKVGHTKLLHQFWWSNRGSRRLQQ